MTDETEILRQQLADARAEIERHRTALERIAEETAATWVADVASEALAAPAPEPKAPWGPPYETSGEGCMGVPDGPIETVNSPAPGKDSEGKE